MLKIKASRETVAVGRRRFRVMIDADWGRPPTDSIVAFNEEQMINISRPHNFVPFDEAAAALDCGLEVGIDPRTDPAKTVGRLTDHCYKEEILPVHGKEEAEESRA